MKNQKYISNILIVFLVGMVFLRVAVVKASNVQICVPKEDKCFYLPSNICGNTGGCRPISRTISSGDSYPSSVFFCASRNDPNDCYNSPAGDCVDKKKEYCQLVSIGGTSGINDNTDRQEVRAESDSDTAFPSLEDPLSSIASPQSLLGRIINIIMGIVGSLALIMFIFGGISWMTAGGNEQKVKQSIGIIVWSALGLAVIFLSYALTKLLISGVSF